MNKLSKYCKLLCLVVGLVIVLISCTAAPGERTMERPILPDLSELVVTVAPTAPYNPSVMPDAGDWPTRPLTLIVPFLPGGDTDMYARMFAPHLAEMLGQPIM